METVTIQETFLPVKGYRDLYEIGSFGTVRNARSKRVLSQVYNKKYMTVQLSKRGKRATKYVHKLVGEVFIDGFTSSSFVFHIDGDTTNNHLTNLRLRVPEDMPTILASRTRIYNTRGILQLDMNGNLIKEWRSLEEINLTLGYNKGNISQASNGRIEKAYNCIWRIKEK